MFCWSEVSCNERYQDHQYWMSSTSWSPVMAQGGIFATDGSSPWGTANRIFVKYCSSDFWSGDVGASSATYGYNFRGARIVSSVITDLLQNKGMDAPGQQLLFGGCSAGAIGAMNNLEAVASQVPPTVTVRGFLDAAALLDIQPAGWPWSPDLETLQSLIQELTALVSPVLPDYCSTAFGPGEQYKCFIGQYRMPLITKVPFFMNAPQFDEFELMYDTDNYAPSTPAQLAFVEEFQTGTLALISKLPAGTGVFSPTCLVHCLSGQSTFTDLEVAGTNLGASLSSWYFGHQEVHAVSPCQGWQCTQQCGINGQSGLPCNTGTADCAPVQLAVSSSDHEQPQPVQQQPQQQQQQQQQQPQQQQPQQQNKAATGVVTATESSLSAQQQAVLQCQTQAAAQQAAAASMQASGNPAASQIAAQATAMSAQCTAMAAAGGRHLHSAHSGAGQEFTTLRRLLDAAPRCCSGRGDSELL